MAFNRFIRRIVDYSCWCRLLESKLLALADRAYTTFIIDLIVGCALFILLKPEEIYGQRLLNLTQNFIDWLQTLIEWLMGNPAGLKLNRPLNMTAGNFFLYHIYLWKTYVTFLKPLVFYSLTLLHYSALIGASLSVALFVDLTSVLTIHVFCFHVYAARMYQMQTKGLISLWRLFRSKKYNPLRNRVDSAQFDNQQLSLGTVFFTILVFLLPTVFTYYLVFTYLRLLRHGFRHLTMLILTSIVCGSWNLVIVGCRTVSYIKLLKQYSLAVASGKVLYDTQ